MKRLLKKATEILGQKFLKGTRYLQTSNGVLVEKISGNPYQIWVVSRGLSIFEKFDLRAVPKDKRDYALKQQVKASSPFREFDFSVRWSDGYAAVWVWDKEKQIKAAQQLGVAREIHVFAEGTN